jgi:hypothetical protein
MKQTIEFIRSEHLAVAAFNPGCVVYSAPCTIEVTPQRRKNDAISQLLQDAFKNTQKS